MIIFRNSQEPDITDENLNNMQRIDIGHNTIMSGTTITNHYEITLPDNLKYQIGNNSLEVQMSRMYSDKR